MNPILFHGFIILTLEFGLVSAFNSGGGFWLTNDELDHVLEICNATAVQLHEDCEEKQKDLNTIANNLVLENRNLKIMNANNDENIQKLEQKIRASNTKIRTLVHSLAVATARFEQKTVTSCEGQNSTLTCTNEQSVEIVDAMYGRTDVTTCSSELIDDCPGDKFLVLDYVTRSCQGQQTCEVNATYTIFGNPCPDVEKYLRITYNCNEKIHNKN